MMEVLGYIILLAGPLLLIAGCWNQTTGYDEINAKSEDSNMRGGF